MASKAPNAANLEALGTTRLAQLLIEISEGNALAKRRLRLELAGPDSPTAVANQVRKRIATIARSRSFIDWHNRKSLVDDLEAQRRAVVDQVASRLPTEGLELMWDFSNWPSPSLPVVTTAAERSSTSSIRLSPTSVPSARPRAEELADRVFDALVRNGYGQFDDAPSSATADIRHLRRHDGHELNIRLE
ncbi:MAG: DUF6880 family protein, partial [Acetobacteraceae bacterium]